MTNRSLLSRKDILHLAKLANLSLSEEEISKFQKQLSEILTYISQLNELDTEEVKPTDQVTELVNVYRVDEETNNSKLSQEEALQNAPDKKGNYIKVPAIFNE